MRYLWVLLFLLPGCATTGSQSGSGPLLSAGVQDCATDADCMKFPAGCCGCTAGGKAQAIARKNEDELILQMQQKCSQQMCPQVISTDHSCSSRVACVQGQCRLSL